MTLDPALSRKKIAAARLCLLLQRSRCKLDPLRVLDLALDAGADLVQVREPNAGDRDVLEWCHDVRERTALRKVPLIVNDRVDIALLAGAEGVHLGQGDLPPTAARELAGDGLIIGFSTHSIDEVFAGESEPVDYIGIGPIFDTDTKGLKGQGAEILRALLPKTTRPAFGIGGITPENIELAVAAGLTRLAVSASVCAAAKPELVVRRLLDALPKLR